MSETREQQADRLAKSMADGVKPIMFELGEEAIHRGKDGAQVLRITEQFMADMSEALAVYLSSMKRL